MNMNYTQVLSLIRPTLELSKSEIIVSIIGLLSGSQSLVFQWIQTKEEFVVRKGISCSHDLNETLLNNYLSYFCKYGTAMKLMFDFCYQTLEDHTQEADEELVLCYTLNAYRSCLRNVLTLYIKQLNTIFDKMFANNKSEPKIISLISFKYYLDCDQNNNLLLTTEILWQIFHRIRETAFTQTSNCCLSFAILNAIYERIDFEKNSIKNMIFTLFVDSFKPTLDYFDYLLTNGVIHDPHQEFIFFESEDKDLNSISFWNNCIQTRNVLHEMPNFLAKIFDNLLIAAKSRLMIERLNHFSEENENNFRKPVDLFNQFLSVLNNMFKQNDVFGEPNLLINNCLNAITDENESQFEVIPKSLEICSLEKTQYDSHLNYFDVYAMSDQFHYNYENISFELKDNNHFNEYQLPQKTIKPIELIINEAITQTMDDICGSICSSLINLIINEYKKYFSNFCDYYLLRSSGVLSTYCIDLFQNINAINSSQIDNIFIFENQPTFDSMPDIKPFISYQNLRSEPIQFFNSVHLIYSDISWPFSIMFNNEVIALFNKAFQLLLKVKYSKWSLDQLMFSQQLKARQLNNKLENLTRFKLQNSVNKLCNHFMFAINAHINEALIDFSQTTNFAELLEKHNKFISALKQTIFYRQDTFRNLVKKLIQLCAQLQNVWKSDKKDESKLKLMNLDIDRCVYLFDSFYEVINKN